MEVLKNLTKLECLKQVQLVKDYAIELKFLIYIEKGFDATQLDVKKPNYHFGDFLHFCYFIMNEKTEVKLKTFEWWTEQSCGTTQLITIDSYDKITQKWTKSGSLRIDLKFRNFHNCTLNVHSSIFHLDLLRWQELFGIPIMPERYYKTIEIREISENKMSKIFAEQGNYTHNSILMFMTSVMDVKHYVDKFIPQTEVHMGSIFLDDTLIAMLPFPQHYGPYEKMLFPFDILTWKYLLISFGIGFVIIFVINRFSRRVQDIVYGERVQHAAFNLVAIFFGADQSILPSSLFARLLWLLFTFYCLIFRTAYQGVFFEMFTTNITKPQPETVLDLKMENYTTYILDDLTGTRIQYLKEIVDAEKRPNIIPCNLIDISLHFVKLFNETSKTAIIGCHIDVMNLRNLFKSVPDLLYEDIVVHKYGIRVYKNNYMYHNIEQTMQRIIEAGIPKAHLQFIIDVALYSQPRDLYEPQVFALKNLEFGFVTWLCACSIAVVVFMLELIWTRIANFVRNQVGRQILLNFITRNVLL